MENKNINLKWALTYAEHGFSVIPVKPNSKIPAIVHADKPPLTTEQVKELWTRNPNYGVALKMDKIFSIDVDTPQHNGTTKVNGYKSLKESIPKEWLTPTLTALTPSGGTHFYYLKKDGLPDKSLAGILKGIDIQAQNNSISIVPPTQINGKPYTWKNVNNIMSPSKELVNFLQSKLTADRENNLSLDYTHIEPTWTGKLINMLFYPEVKGKRNDHLTRLIGYLLSTRADISNCYELAIFANQHFQEPLPDKELNKTFNSILRREIAKYGKQPKL